MVIFTREVGSMTKPMAMEHIDMLMGLLMLETGSRISNMEEESKTGLMVQSTKVFIKMERSTEMASLLSRMAAFIRASLSIMKFVELANTFGLMAKCTRVNGIKTECMEPERLFGGMETSTKAHL